MITEFHFLRPWWFLAFIPLCFLIVWTWRKTPKLHAWEEICDSHLLQNLIQKDSQGKGINSLLCLYIAVIFMIVSLTGPTWFKYPVSTYKSIQPRVVLLDMSENMLEKDLSPDRLSRAKFKLRDLFSRKGAGQFGMVVFTGEPFVVSPLTDDGETIASLLSTLTPDVMPVNGLNLDTALTEAGQLIKQAGYNHGQILVLTADTPSSAAINQAKQLAAEGIHTSILPMRADKDLNPLYQSLANAGQGELLLYTADSTDLQQWMDQRSDVDELKLNDQDDIPLWRDEGRWFLIFAALFLLPVFRRGWLQRMAV